MARSTSMLITTLAGLGLLVAACGSADDRGAAPDAGAGQPAAADAAFPITIEHRYGETTLESRPERVVTVGLTDHDAFLALGVVPVGTTEWFGGHPSAVWPWAQDRLGDTPPEVVGTATELDLERIAALEPDVIVGLYGAMTAEQHATLTQIAPTVAQPDDHVDYGIPWQELTTTVGRIVGQEEEAATLIEGVEERFAEVRDAHPAFSGATAVIASPYDGIYVYNDDVANSRILAALGFTYPGELGELIGDADGTTLSAERVDLLDADVLVWVDAQPGEGPLADELYRGLDVVTEGREVFSTSSTELGGALSFSSVLSLQRVLDEFVPLLEAAVDGDPATEVPPA